MEKVELPQIWEKKLPMPQLRPGSILIFLFQLVCFTLFAQTDFREGFILQPNGDTLKGWIDYRSDGPNQDLCRFRATPNGPLETFAQIGRASCRERV